MNDWLDTNVNGAEIDKSVWKYKENNKQNIKKLF